jgi:hypothetical protein
MVAISASLIDNDEKEEAIVIAAIEAVGPKFPLTIAGKGKPIVARRI